MKILSISDKVVDYLYSPACRDKFGEVDLIISCGDLPYYYMEYVLTSLDKPLLFVRGNHASRVEYSRRGGRTEPLGAVDLHRKAIMHSGLIIAGVEGSVRYNRGEYQYTQAEMWGHIYSLVPRLLWNRATQGRALDILVTHAPPRGIHDKEDNAHTGANAFRWLIETFQPKLHLHGHIHVYNSAEITQTMHRKTRVLNTYGYRLTEL
jgi:Icc-related predicted phosphoesterase